MKTPHWRKSRKPHRDLPNKPLLIVCVVAGILLGVSFWFFISRCDETDCLSHYFPLVEIFIGGFIGIILPLYLFDK